MLSDKILKELDMFKKISSIDDYNKITGEELSYDDFVRLDCILDIIEFDNLRIHLHNKFYERFKEIERQLEEIEKEYISIDDELGGVTYYDDMMEEWLREFIMNIDDKATREELMDKAKITY